jgi:sensor histidine kinase YesM
MTATVTPPAGNAAACDPKSEGFHPLELFPIFRRIPPSFLRDFIYTIIWNTLFALFFTVLAVLFDSQQTFLGAFWPTFVFAQCIGFIIFWLVDLGHWLLPGISRRSTGMRLFYWTVVPLVGTFAGYYLGSTLLHFDEFRSNLLTLRGAVLIGSVSLILSTVLLLIFIPRERAARLQAAFEKEQARVAAAEREATLAQLKLLEAQVEPHFLYNTLANVVSLIDSDPATARRMLDRLITLLRGAAAAAGSGGATLSAQIEDLRAYLDLMVMRMGDRLTFAIDMPSELGALHVPPLLLQPLVENAIRHALEPKVEGGAVRIVARRSGDNLEIVVADTGVGFAATRAAPSNGTGLGLANVRERLHALYGPRARLIIEDNQPSGARVTLRIPAEAP